MNLMNQNFYCLPATFCVKLEGNEDVFRVDATDDEQDKNSALKKKRHG